MDTLNVAFVDVFFMIPNGWEGVGQHHHKKTEVNKSDANDSYAHTCVQTILPTDVLSLYGESLGSFLSSSENVNAAFHTQKSMQILLKNSKKYNNVHCCCIIVMLIVLLFLFLFVA